MNQLESVYREIGRIRVQSTQLEAQIHNYLEFLETAEFSDVLDFAAKRTKRPNCTAGTSHFCTGLDKVGGACVSASKQCLTQVDGAAKSAADYVAGVKRGAGRVDAPKKFKQTKNFIPAGKHQAPKGGAYDLHINDGAKFVGAKRLKELSSLIDDSTNKTLKELQPQLDEVNKKLDKLMSDDLDAATKSPEWKEHTRLSALVDAERTALREKANAAMVSIREDLVKTGLSPEDAKAAAGQVKILKSAAKEVPEEELRNNVAEFFQMTGWTSEFKLKKDTARAYADTTDGAYGSINIGRQESKEDQKTALWHEMGHLLEDDDKLPYASREWLEARATGPVSTLNEIVGAKSFEDNEMAYPGHFIHPYVGKFYDEVPPLSEVLAVGFQYFTSAEKMKELYIRDPEHFLFTLGTIR